MFFVVLSPHIHLTSISNSLYLLSFSMVLTEVLVSRGIVMSMRRHVLSVLFFSTISGLLAATFLSVWMGMSHRIVTLSFSVRVLGSCSYHRSFTSMPNSLQIFQCMCAAALLWWWMYSVLASSGQPETRWSMVLSKRPHSLHFRSTSGFLRMLCWCQRVGRLWSWAAMIKPSDSALGPAAFSHLWVFVLVHVNLFHLLWVFSVERFWFQLGPELLVTLVFGLGLCAASIGGVRLILCRWYCRFSQFTTEVHWLSADGVQGFPVVMVFDKVEEGVLRLLEVLGSLRIDDFGTTPPLSHFIVLRCRPVEIWIYDS